MALRSPGQRFLFFVYGNKNIVGCIAALSGIGLFFGGAIHEYWQEIVAGCYAIGYLAAPAGRQFETDLNAQMNTVEIQAALNKLTSDIKPLVPVAVADLVADIKQSIVSILPLLGKSDGSANPQGFTIRQTALEYLPNTIRTYLSLPSAYRNTFPVQDGKTATQLLIAQLTLLDEKMKEIVANFLADDTQALLSNGRFLDEKFARQPFLKAV